MIQWRTTKGIVSSDTCRHKREVFWRWFCATFVWTSERGYKSSATVSLVYPSTHILCSLHPVNRIINSKLKKYFFKQSLRVPGKLGPCCWSFSLTSCAQIRHTTEQHIYKGYLSTIEGRVIFFPSYMIFLLFSGIHNFSLFASSNRWERKRSDFSPYFVVHYRVRWRTSLGI